MARPKAFDPAEKLNGAVTLFWRQGFASTSIPQLEEQLGINRFSIYATYGDKRSFFLSAVKQYRDELVRNLLEPLEDGTEGLPDLRQFFGAFRTMLGGSGGTRGCLLCNTATELGTSDEEIAGIITLYFERLEKAVLACLRRARRFGEIGGSNADLRAHAALFRLAIQGLLVQLRLVDDDRDARREIRTVESFLESMKLA